MRENPATQSPWLKKVLIPFWVIQLIFTTMLLGGTCYVVTSAGMPPTQLIVLIICISSLLLAITEITLFAIHNLRPIAYLIFQGVKTAFWFIVLIIAIVVTTDQQRIGDGGGERYNPGLLVLLDGLLEGVVLVLVHVGTLIYASIIYHRYRVSKADEQRNSIHQHGRFHRTSQLDTAEYQTLDSPSDRQSNGLVGRSPVERDDGTEVRPGMQIPSLVWTQELRGGCGEVHELATTRSVRSLEPDGGCVQASPIAS